MRRKRSNMRTRRTSGANHPATQQVMKKDIKEQRKIKAQRQKVVGIT